MWLGFVRVFVFFFDITILSFPLGRGASLFETFVYG